MSFLRPSSWQAIGASIVGALLMALAPALARGASGRPTVKTDRGCYVVGAKVRVTGSGFAPNRMFDIAIDGVDFGRQTTDSAGRFSQSLSTGGLGANVVQHVNHLDATDGTVSADTTFTVTRRAGARFLAASGNPNTLRAPFQVWGFALNGKAHTVYVHYVAPSGHVRSTAKLGRTGGQCGYLLTGRRRVFPFSPSSGTWTLQVDTHSSYRRHPSGPVWRIAVRIS